MTDYLTVIEVLAIHEDQIARHGGSAGVRDRGLLRAVLYRPQTGYYADLIEEAAALWQRLAQNHPFIDSNKGTTRSQVFVSPDVHEMLKAAYSVPELPPQGLAPQAIVRYLAGDTAPKRLARSSP